MVRRSRSRRGAVAGRSWFQDRCKNNRAHNCSLIESARVCDDNGSSAVLQDKREAYRAHGRSVARPTADMGPHPLRLADQALAELKQAA